ADYTQSPFRARELCAHHLAPTLSQNLNDTIYHEQDDDSKNDQTQRNAEIFNLAEHVLRFGQTAGQQLVNILHSQRMRVLVIHIVRRKNQHVNDRLPKNNAKRAKERPMRSRPSARKNQYERVNS